MITTILDKASLHLASVDDGASQYKHTFGGPARHEGARLPGLDRPAHLLYCFNLEDPAVRLTIPGTRWLPIYYAFRSQGSEHGLVYRVLADDRIEVLNKPFPLRMGQDIRKFYDKFPPEFRQRKIRVTARAYDPKDLNHLALYGPLFGAAMLSEKEKLALKRKIEKEQPGMIYDFTGRGPPYSSLEELMEHLGGILYPHGEPDEPCPNKSCKTGRQRSKLALWLHIEPEEEDRGDYKRIYQAAAGADSGRLHVLICPRCHTICVDNLCT
jgi:hypothetical protein